MVLLPCCHCPHPARSEQPLTAGPSPRFMSLPTLPSSLPAHPASSLSSHCCFSSAGPDGTHVHPHISIKQEAFTSCRAIFPEGCDKDVVWVGFLMISGTLRSHSDLTSNTLEKSSANPFTLTSAKCFLPCTSSQHPSEYHLQASTF